MKIFYVVGSNSSKSLSPVIFNYWFKNIKSMQNIVTSNLAKRILILKSKKHLRIKTCVD